MPGDLRLCPLARLEGEPAIARLWDEVVRERGDVYYERSYLRAAAAGERGRIMLALYECPDGAVVYPFVRRPLDELAFGDDSAGRCDIITPYEYGGPLIHADGEGTVEVVRAGFAATFADYCRDAGVVSEFVRFHPLLKTQRGWETCFDVRLSARNVVVDLGVSQEALFAGYNRRTRRNVRLASRRGARVERAARTPGDVLRFMEIYLATMERRGAQPFYYFTPPYFERLAALPADKISLYFAREPGGEVISAALFLHDGRYAHYHLGGRLAAHSRLCANSLLFHTAALEMRAAGRRLLHLGGAGGDQRGLETFKAGFSGNGVDYFVGRRIHDADTYRALVRARATHAGDGGEVAEGGFFPAYRIDGPPVDEARVAEARR